jgi:hypothetical protein
MDLYRILALIAVITLVIHAVFNIIYLIDPCAASSTGPTRTSRLR